MELGRDFAVKEIYTFYRCLRIVTLKRRKNRSGGHGSTRNVAAGLADRCVLREHDDWKESLIEEYATLRGEDVPARGDKATNSRMFKAAVQFIHVNLLQDLSPPWIDHNFPQALPGDGVLARYMKPTFLRWPRDIVGTLFGREVFETWSKECQAAGLELGAVLGRPLYVCTRTRPCGEVCGAMAAMSPLMEQREKHKEFVCQDCAGRNAPREDRALPVLRLIRIYLQVRVEDRWLAMRSAPMHILLHAPLDDSMWGFGHTSPGLTDTTLLLEPARPANLELEITNRTGWRYTARESNNIWLYSTHQQGATPNIVG